MRPSLTGSSHFVLCPYGSPVSSWLGSSFVPVTESSSLPGCTTVCPFACPGAWMLLGLGVTSPAAHASCADGKWTEPPFCTAFRSVLSGWRTQQCQCRLWRDQLGVLDCLWLLELNRATLCHRLLNDTEQIWPGRPRPSRHPELVSAADLPCSPATPSRLLHCGDRSLLTSPTLPRQVDIGGRAWSIFSLPGFDPPGRQRGCS